jgi:cAMP-dependent protein kinase regulator
MCARPTAEEQERQLRKHRDRALGYVAAGKLKPALEAYRAILAIHPGDTAARQKAAELALRLGHKEEALAEYQLVVEGYAAAGFLLKAIAICKVMLQLDASLTAAQERLAALYSQERLRRGGSGGYPAAAASGDGAEAAAPPGGEASATGAGPDPAAAPLDPRRLPATPLFSDLPREEFVALLSRLTVRQVAAGEEIVTEGAPGDAMYMVVQGRVEVWRGAPEGGAATGVAAPRVTIATLEDGAFFGEMALLTNAARLASVTAVTETELLVLDRAVVAELQERFPAVARVIERFHKERLLGDLLAASPVFRVLPAAAKAEVMAASVVQTVAEGTTLCEQGLPGPGLYVILRGRCAVAHRAPDGAELPVPEMVEGELFGELSLIAEQAATATVRAATPAVLLHLPAREVHRLLLCHPAAAEALKRLGGERLGRTLELLRPYGLEALRRFLV